MNTFILHQTYIHLTHLSYAPLYLHTWAPAHARAHTFPRTRASAHRRRRRTQRPAPHRRPAECVPPRWRAAGQGNMRVRRYAHSQFAGRCTCILAGPFVAREDARLTTCECRFWQVTISLYSHVTRSFTCSSISLAKSSAVFRAKHGVRFWDPGGFVLSTIFTIFSNLLLRLAIRNFSERQLFQF